MEKRKEDVKGKNEVKEEKKGLLRRGFRKRGEAKEEKSKKIDVWGMLIYPHLTEKSMNMVELENKLVFIVNKKADKKKIKEAVENEFDVKVDWVRTEITTRGQKKAYIKINPEFSAADIASKLGML